MKKIVGCLILLSVTLFISPAAAQVLYSNGPTNGNTDAWTVNFGFIVSDSFYVPASGIGIGNADFAMWLFPGDILSSAELSITSSENGGTTYFDETLGFTQSGCTMNSFGYNVCNESTSFNGPTLNSGVYWLNLQNASVASGDPVYWDENSGGAHALPAGASENNVGTIPSESFTLNSSFDEGKKSLDSSQQPTTPEPSSILMLGAGILGAASLLRLKIQR